MTGQTDRKPGAKSGIGLTVFVLYVAVLASAAMSEVFELGWFDFPVFK